MTPELKRNRPARPLPAPRAASSASFCLLDRALGALVKVLACLGRGEPTRRPEQQADAEALFKLSDGLGDGGLSNAELFRGAGERAGFDDADEYLHRSQPIHGHSSKECMLSPGAASAIGKDQTI